MTSEVAILTKHAVALAADSAVTSGGKIFNTVDKVFALSKYEPVGIMAYSSPHVMGVPVDTVIKEFRRQQGRESSEYLGGYATRFEEFLRSDAALFGEDARRRALLQLVQMFVSELDARADTNLQTRVRRGLKFNKTNMIRALSDAVADIARRTRAAPRIAVQGPVRALRSAISDGISEQSKVAIQGLGRAWPISRTMRKRISGLALEYLFRDVGFGGETGFAIAGFGTRDVFPRLRAFEFYCSALGLHKIRHYGQLEITDDCGSRIVPFAQRDVVATFMEGIDPIYKAFLEHFPETFFEQKKALLLDGANPQNQEAAVVESLGVEFRTALQDELQRLMDREFVHPTMDVVAMMPKDELATLAEALVNVTALKRKASRYAETVGGPTDVAVISKGDGFVWVRRKHYFDPGLNPGFMKRYLEG
jgi:urease gamma subunit